MKNPAEEAQENIIRIIEESGISLMSLSRRSGVAYNTLRSISKGGGNPTLSTISQVWEAVFEPMENTDKTCLTCKHRESEVVDGFFLCGLAFLSCDSIKACKAHAEEVENDVHTS